jgi:hypothetical protein
VADREAGPGGRDRERRRRERRPAGLAKPPAHEEVLADELGVLLGLELGFVLVDLTNLQRKQESSVSDHVWSRKEGEKSTHAADKVHGLFGDPF